MMGCCSDASDCVGIRRRGVPSVWCHFLALLLCLVLAAAAASALDADEVAAMNAMRAAWGGSAPANWTGGPRCDWIGFNCSGDGHVIMIRFVRMGLVGRIPSEVGLLRHLTIL